MTAKPRPTWQVDLKWAAGILACLATVVCGVVFSLTEITERGHAEPLSATLVAWVADEQVSDEEFEALQDEAAANPDGFVSISPLDIEVRGEEVAGLSKEDTVIVFSARLARVLYDEGPEAAEALIMQPEPDEDGEEQEPIELGPAGQLNGATHSTLTTVFLASLAVAVALLGAMALLSRGFGRLGAPGVVLALSTGPLAAVWFLVNNAVSSPDGENSPYETMAQGAIGGIAGDLKSVFLNILIIAVVWVVVAVAGTLLLPLARKVDRKLAKPGPAPPWVRTPGPSA